VPDPTATAVPDPTATDVPATAVPDPTATDVPATAVPDPTASLEPATAVPDPTASLEPATAVPDPTATGVPATAVPDPTATAVPDPTATALPLVTATPLPDPTATAEPTATVVPAAPAAGQPADAAISLDAPTPRTSTFTYILRANGSGPTELYDAPDGNVVDVTYTYLNGDVIPYPQINPTYFGNPLVYRVVEGEPGAAWARVQLPTRPAGQTRWLRTDGFDWSSSNHLVQINVATNRLAVFEGDILVLESVVASGRPRAPTPSVSTYIDEIIPGPNQAYGSFIVSIGAFSESINDFSSGIPKLAIHGTNQPDLMGQYVSSGTVRVTNEVIEQIVAIVPIGSKVEIHR